MFLKLVLSERRNVTAWKEICKAKGMAVRGKQTMHQYGWVAKV